MLLYPPSYKRLVGALAVQFTGFICDVRPAYSAVPMSKSKASRFGNVGAKTTTTTATLFVPQIQIKFTIIGSDKIKISTWLPDP